MRPNTRVQRTRSSPAAPRSPLTRHPLGRLKGQRVAGLLVALALAGPVGCNSTSILYAPVASNQRHAVLTAYHEHGLFHLGSCGFSQDGERYRIELLSQRDSYTRSELALQINDEQIEEFGGTVKMLPRNRVDIDLYVVDPGGKRTPLPVNGVRKYE